MPVTTTQAHNVTGEFVTLADERYYCIGNVDKIAPFLINLVSDSDHWMFIASNGGVTAGRVSPETALFPYITVDKIYDSTAHTGSKTLLRAEKDGRHYDWEPFNEEHDTRYAITRNLYKSMLGDKLLFEEINHDLQLAFRYRWVTSDAFGFVRQVELENLGGADYRVDLIDGLQNLLPAGTPRFTQTNASYLVDAYKWNELDSATGVALFTLFSGISDRAEPCESLKATTVFCLGLEGRRVLLSSNQFDRFRRGEELAEETRKRGVRAAYFINASFDLTAESSREWQLVAEVDQTQTDSLRLIHELADPNSLKAAIARSIENGSDALARIMAAGDGFQETAEENVSAHHYANVLFNVLRGGIVDDQYHISARDFRGHVERFNRDVFRRHHAMLQELPRRLDFGELLATIQRQGDPQLERLGFEYLPIKFGRRHGDPSRPWNQFAIRLTDEHGEPLLSYEGNWRDIFQNWEALLLSYPEFIENVIAKFVNASTMDGYNPYRITNEGIDWEVEDPDDPWSYIGYWGDHQIIYLQKLLELSTRFHPDRLVALLRQPVFSYANVPYRIRPFEAILDNAKSTVDYDNQLASRIEQRVSELGADGKLMPDPDGQVYQVNLLEKLLVPLLSKLGNLVVDGGIWLNTQRPEWNDANNALVGQGLSMVTLCYMRRYVSFLQQMLADQSGTVNLSEDVGQWLVETAEALNSVREALGDGPIDARQRFQLLAELGQAASRYRQRVYARESLTGSVAQDLEAIKRMLGDALVAIDQSIRSNLREDGLYHAYNLLELNPGVAELDTLYPMLEGQVAALSSGAISPAEAIRLLEALFESDLFRPDQRSFLLYPDRELPGFLDKNRVPAEQVETIPLLARMLEEGDRRVIDRDTAGTYRFNAELTNVGDLDKLLNALAPDYGDTLEAARAPLRALYELVFHHKAFTGRSGGMFGFEGLGSIYWHMVGKLLLAIQEIFFAARDQGADQAACRQLASLYYRVREGLGFNKTPAEYGAFPADPYSHTPAHAGAQQPGMTGQVKEEILTRFGELGVRVAAGSVRFDLALLRSCEFSAESKPFSYLDVDGQWQELTVPQRGMAFSWCQVPIVYRLAEAAEQGVSVTWDDGEHQALPGPALPTDIALHVFRRSGRVRLIELVLNTNQLLS